MDALLFILVITGWVEPPPPTPVCIVDAVYLYHPMGRVFQPALKACSNEPCVIFPLKKSFIKESDNNYKRSFYESIF